jgi:hypothetical protein
MMSPNEPDRLAFGNWNSRFACVLASAVSGRFGVALIDSNNDGRELSVIAVSRDDHGTWQWAQEHGDTGRSGEHQEPDFVYAWGTATPRGTTTFTRADTVHAVPVTPYGSWVFVAPVAEAP